MEKRVMKISYCSEGGRAEEAILRAKDLINERVGIINRIQEVDYIRKIPHYFCYFAQMAKGVQRQILPMGSGTCREQAIAATIGEAIERYCSRYYDKELFIASAYKYLDEPAISPGEVALYSDNQYACAKFPYKQFTEEVVVNWVRGYSLTRHCSVLVPACMVYLSYCADSEVSIWQQSSTGLCCGLSREEAILGGLYETIERDAFMIMWANRLSMPKLCWNDDRAGIRREDIFFKINLINITSDIGIPVILSVLTNPKNQSPKMAIGASCNLDPIKAAEKALVESLHLPSLASGEIAEFNLKWKDRFTTLKGYRHHAILYANPSAFSHSKFIINSRDIITENELPNLSRNNVKDDLNTSVSLIAKAGYDIIVVDITTKDIRDAGFIVVRVIIPGAIPLNWGMPDLCHNGGRRLYEVPKRLGYMQRDSREEELNRDPHPFP